MASCRWVPLRKKDDRNARARCDRNAVQSSSGSRSPGSKSKGLKLKDSQ